MGLLFLNQHGVGIRIVLRRGRAALEHGQFGGHQRIPLLVPETFGDDSGIEGDFDVFGRQRAGGILEVHDAVSSRSSVVGRFACREEIGGTESLCIRRIGAAGEAADRLLILKLRIAHGGPAEAAVRGGVMSITYERRFGTTVDVNVDYSPRTRETIVVLGTAALDVFARQSGELIGGIKEAVALSQLSATENVGNTVGATQCIITGAFVVMQRMPGVVHGMIFTPFAEKRHQRSGGTAQVHEFPACGAALLRAAGAGELIFDAAVAVVLAVLVVREVEHRHIVPHLKAAAHIRGDRQRNLNFAGKSAHRILEIGVRAGELAAAGVAGLDRDAVDGFIRDIVGRFQLDPVADRADGLDVALGIPAGGARIGDLDQLRHPRDVDLEGVRRFQRSVREFPRRSPFLGGGPEIE